MKTTGIIKTLFPLFIVQFFTWLGMFAMWIYSTPVIAKYIFNNTDDAIDTSALWVGMYFAFYSTLAAFLAFMLPKFEKRPGIQSLHAIALIAGATGLFLLYIFKNKFLLFISFAFIGIAWSSISTVPYDLVGKIAPEEKMSMYFKTFNFSVVIPQVTAAFLLGWLNKNVFKGESIYIILTGAVCMLTAGVIMAVISKRKVYKIEE